MQIILEKNCSCPFFGQTCFLDWSILFCLGLGCRLIFKTCPKIPPKFRSGGIFLQVKRIKIHSRRESMFIEIEMDMHEKSRRDFM